MKLPWLLGLEGTVTTRCFGMRCVSKDKAQRANVFEFAFHSTSRKSIQCRSYNKILYIHTMGRGTTFLRIETDEFHWSHNLVQPFLGKCRHSIPFSLQYTNSARPLTSVLAYNPSSKGLQQLTLISCSNLPVKIARRGKHIPSMALNKLLQD